jgi:outer membrane protein assembly factor BamB
LPQFRGPTRDDVSKETGLLKSWPTGGPKKLWSFDKAGMGYSGFSVAGGRAFTNGTRDGKEILLCLDAAKGTELWVAKLGDILSNGWGDGPRSTPTVDGDRVYTLGGEGTLACVSVKDGKELWRTTMDSLGGKRPGWGYTESVLVDGKQVVCTPGGAKGAVAAIEKMTGKPIWQTTDFTDGAQYSSLVPATINGVPQYVQMTMQSVVGIAAKDGKVVWKMEWSGRTAVIPTPIVRGNQVFVTAGYGVGCKSFTVGADGSITELYRNGNMENHHGGVVLVGDYVYGHSKGGWTCLDFKTGDVKWVEKSKLEKGSITAAGGMLYLLGEKTGDCVLVEANPNAFTEKGRFKLEPQASARNPKGGIWPHPVVANGRLYLRDQEFVHCYAVK